MFGSCCCIDVDCYNDIYNEKTVRGYKEHKCCECRQPIKRREKHEHVKLLADGHWSEYRTCLPCKNMRDSLFTCGFHFTMLEEDFRECYGFSPYEIPALEREES